MQHTRTSIAYFLMATAAFAQPALMEPPDYPPIRPGPAVVHDGSYCFLVASGTITPGDVDWVRVAVPWATTRTVVDVDFPTGAGGSVLLMSRVGGSTVLGLSDNNAARDAVCGLSGSTSPVGSPSDSAVEFGAIPRHSVIDIGVSGAPDTGFTGQHTHSFEYEVWMHIIPVLCATDADCADSVACTVETCEVSTGICDSVPNHAECADSSWCNGEEVCHPTQGCRPGTPVNCNDGIFCTLDSCNENLDSCVHVPLNSRCNNWTFCDGEEWCDAQLGCREGTPPDCDDGDDCTVDSCDPALDECVSTPSDDACDDGLFCNGVESCDPDTGCAAGEDPCPGQLCDETNDRCVECLGHAACDDGLFCNGAESCDPEAGCVAGDDPCADQFCDEQRDRCVDCLSDADCDDGMFCNGQEACREETGECEAGAEPDCDDGVACTVDFCDLDTDACAAKLDVSACDDGLYCNGVETCDALHGCVAGQAPCDGMFCDESNDRCVLCLVDAHCDNGVFCDGVELCDTQAGRCYRGPARVCNDQNPCTTDYCHATLDQCVHVPNDSHCDDGLFCNGAEHCDVAMGCVAGVEPCGDGVCDEAMNRCVDCLADEDCDDGVYCNGAESCDLASGACEAGVPPCGTEDNCDERNRGCLTAESFVVVVDVLPGQCPNVHRLNNGGHLAVAIAGSPGLPVSRIDVSSIRLGVAGGKSWIAPNGQRKGPPPIKSDVTSDRSAEPCACRGRSPDGVKDLVMRFDNAGLADVLGLGKVVSGTMVEFVVTGNLLDGTPFSGVDCATIQIQRKGKR